MVKVTIVQGKLDPTLEKFEAETEAPLMFDALPDAVMFSERLLACSKPVRAISSYYDIDAGERVEYETVKLCRVEMAYYSDELYELVREIKKSPAK